MRQKHLLSKWLLLMALIVMGAGFAWADDVTGTITFSNAANATAINSSSVTGNDSQNNKWTITTVGTTSFTANSSYYQVGSGNKPATSITFTTTLADDVNITAMSAKFGGFNSTAGTVTLKVGDTTVGTGSLNGTSDVTVSNTSNATGKVLTVSVTNISKGVKCYNISYTYTTGTSTPKCATPTFSPAAGTYTSAQNVTISTTTADATIYYTTDGTDPTTGSSVYSSAITVDETKTIKAMAVKAEYNNSAIASATYTIVTPSTIAAVREQGTGSVLTKGIVTSCVNTTGYIQDESAAICVYGTSLTVGDEIIVSGTLTTYNGLLEIKDPVVSVVSSGNAVTPTVKTIAEINSDYTTANNLQGMLVKIENATVKAISSGNTTIAQGENTIIVRGIDSSVEYAVDDVITLTGNIGCYNAAQIANPTDVVVKKDPVLSVNPTTATVFTYEEGKGPSDDQMFTITGANLTSTTITASVTGDFEITDDKTYSSSLTLASGDVISVRLKAGLAKGDYSGTLTLSTTGATDVTVNLSGSVTGTTYAISIDDNVTGGTIEADLEKATEGATVTLTAKPDAAYTFGSWTVYKDDMTTTVTVTDNQFTMPACEVYVTATFTAKPTYAITCTYDDTKGMLTTTPDAAYEGQSVKLEYTTEDGYDLSSIVITKTADGSATNITPTASGDDYTFVMPGYAVTATATFVSNTFDGSFVKVTSISALEDGGYYVLHNTKAMNSTVTSGRMGATDVTITNGVITNPDKSIVWKLVKNGDKWDLYSESEGKYCYIEGTNTSSFKMAASASYHYAVTAYGNGGFKFKTNHTSGRGINYGNGSFGSYADSNNPTVDLYKYITLTERTITFDGNGGTYNEATTYTQTVYDGVEATLDANTFTRTDNEFAGWNTQSDGLGDSYDDGAKITVTGADLTLYAQWAPLYTLTVDDNIDGGNVSIEGNVTSASEGTEITLSYTPTAGHAFSAWNVYKADDETTKVTVTDNKFEMPSYNVVVSAIFVEVPTYSLVTNVSQLVSGKHYIIASGTNGSVKAMGKQNDNNRAAVSVTATNGIIPETTGVYEFIIYGPDAEGYFTIYDKLEKGYLYVASSGTNNRLKTQAVLDNTGKWSIAISSEGVATIKGEKSGIDRNWMRFNSTLFACYNQGQEDIYLYVKDGEATPTETIHVSDAKYATYCSENALDFTNTGLTAYIAKINGTSVSFETVTKVPAYSGVLLKANAAGDFTVNATATVDDVKNNVLKGVVEETTLETVPTNGIYVLRKEAQGVGFYKTTGTSFKLSAHSAYLPALAGGGARTFIGLEEATGIDGIFAEKASNGEVYNLQGQRVSSQFFDEQSGRAERSIHNSQLKKGLYIMNGKKVLVK